VEQVHIGDIASYEGQEVTLKGWLYHKRSSGRLQFLLVRDGTGLIQAVLFQGDVSEEAFALAELLTQESSIVVRGVVRAEKRAPGGYELAVKSLELVQRAEPYPITPKEHGIEFLMEHRHLWLRSLKQQAALKVRAEVMRSAREYLDENGYVNVDAPILTPAACEGTTSLFAVDYFGETAYLSQSGQLYSEAAILAFGRVYCCGPAFRAEKSKTRRHLTEFWIIEPEMAYADLEECMRVEEELVSHIVQAVLKRRAKELEVLERDTSLLEKVRPPFPRLSYDQAVELLRGWGFEFRWGDDFGSPEETALTESFHLPTFIHRYPVQCKAFYMAPDPKHPEVSLSVDLLAPEGYGEIIGGGERIAELKLLERRIEEYGLPREAFDWYLDLRRYGSVPHSGFGLGVERLVAWICGLKHLREAIPFPRMLERIYP